MENRLKQNSLTTMSPVDSFYEALAHQSFTKSSYRLENGLMVRNFLRYVTVCFYPNKLNKRTNDPIAW